MRLKYTALRIGMERVQGRTFRSVIEKTVTHQSSSLTTTCRSVVGPFLPLVPLATLKGLMRNRYLLFGAVSRYALRFPLNRWGFLFSRRNRRLGGAEVPFASEGSNRRLIRERAIGKTFNLNWGIGGFLFLIRDTLKCFGI